jgi:hypothetical protein
MYSRNPGTFAAVLTRQSSEISQVAREADPAAIVDEAMAKAVHKLASFGRQVGHLRSPRE